MLVSIIVPVYNSEVFLERCLESCLRQDFSDLELIVVDDGSTDGSYKIASVIAEKDSRLHLFHQENSGASAARNKGLDVATGDYVMFVDSDDWIDPEMLDDMIKIIRRFPEVQIVQTSEPGEMKEQERSGLYNSNDAVRSLLEGSWWGSVCKLIKSDYAKQIRFPIKTISEDYLFNYQLFSRIDALYYVKQSYYHWTIRPGSLSKSNLSIRKFDEFYNVKTVSEFVAVDCPINQQLADVHLAGTCLKLLFMIFHNHAEILYNTQLKELLDCVRKKYLSFVMNPIIPKNERLLLSMCFSSFSAKFIQKMYHFFK